MMSKIIELQPREINSIGGGEASKYLSTALNIGAVAVSNYYAAVPIVQFTYDMYAKFKLWINFLDDTAPCNLSPLNTATLGLGAGLFLSIAGLYLRDAYNALKAAEKSENKKES